MSGWGSGIRGPRRGIGSAAPRSRYVVETTSVIFAEPAPSGSVLADPRMVFLGPDQQGELLEVMAIQTDDGGLLIIHASRSESDT